MAALLLALLLAVPAKDPGRALAQRVQAFYAHSKDFSASFRQHYTYVAIGRTEDSEGVVQVKKPGLVRWDYANPDRRTLYIEGRTLWIWRPDDQEAQVKRDFGGEQLGSAFTFLWGKGNLLKEFSPKSVPTPAGLPQGDALELTPAVLLLLLACAPSRTVMVNGRQVPYEEGAGIELGVAKASFDAGKYDLAAQQFATFIQRYRDSDLLDEALFRHGQALAKTNKLQEAQVALQDFLERRPTSPFKNSAVVELAAIQAKLGQPAPPLPPVDPSQMSEQDKNQAAAALAESYARNGQWGEAMRWGARALETASSAESEPRLN